MTELEATGVGDHPPPYMIFVVVFLFFLTGLMGFLICHLLKMKGYRCRAGDMDDDDDEEEEVKLEGTADDEHEDNQDTVDQILKCIMENEANMEAFNEMLGNHNICVRHDPRLRKESIGGVPPHLHTVHSGTEHNSCHLCAQVQSKKGRRQSRTPRLKQRPGEQIVFSVGRFRVTHTDKKLHGSPNQMVSSDQLDQSLDSEEQKGGYNLRSMFKDTRAASENANGAVPNVGKRRKSVTLFGLRRGSDPVGIKVIEGTGRETGGVKFAVQKQPVVLEDVVQEEVLQAENTELSPESSAKPGFKPETKPPKNQSPAPLQTEVKISSSVNSSSSEEKKESHDFSSLSEPYTNLTTKCSSESMGTSAPSSLFISSSIKKLGHVSDKILKNEDSYDPRPLQTSTPIVAMTGSIPGSTLINPTSPSESSSCTVFPVTQTPPDQDSNPDLEPGFGGSLALISLGSSPQSSFPINSPSSFSLLKTPTSSQADLSPVPTRSPKLAPSQAMFSQSLNLSQTSSPLEAPTLSPLLHGSPKVDNIPVSLKIPTSSPVDQNPSFRKSPNLTLKSGSVMSITSMIKGDSSSSTLPVKEQELPFARISKSELKTVGILKSAEHSPVEAGFKGSVLFSPSDQFSKDKLISLSLSPSSPLSPCSSVGSKISSVAIVKASPDSKREFSVVTIAEEAEPSTSVKDEMSEVGAEFEKGEVSPAAGQAYIGQPESQTGEMGPQLIQEKDDMVQMEDIRDCKVMQEEERKEKEEKVERTLHTQD